MCSSEENPSEDSQDGSQDESYESETQQKELTIVLIFFLAKNEVNDSASI